VLHNADYDPTKRCRDLVADLDGLSVHESGWARKPSYGFV
jgi:hypothetical protein